MSQKRFYVPSAYQISGHIGKGEFAVSAGRGNGYDFNLSYSVTRNISVLAAIGRNNRYERRSTLWDDYGIKNNNNSYSARIGYTGKVSSSKILLLTYDAYLGISKTSVKNYWSFDETRNFTPLNAQFTDAKYNSFFIGGDVVFKIKPAELAITTRLSHFTFQQFEFHETGTNTAYIFSFVKNMKGANAEVILSAGVKYKNLKVFVQGGFSINTNGTNGQQTDEHRLNIGTTIVEHQEVFDTFSFISRIGLQYNFRILKN